MPAPLLMIPGPIELSPAVRDAYCRPAPSHLAPDIIEAFGAALAKMRKVWLAGADSQPFVLPGSGTLAMDSAVANLVDPGDRVLVVNTGYFSDRIAEMARRRGAEVSEVVAEPGDSVTGEEVARALGAGDYAVLLATHVDTSTGVRIDAESMVRAANDAGVISVVDGVCATAGEEFAMQQWGADVYLTGSQKALGLPPGLALLVASSRAMARRATLQSPPPMTMDWDQWRPIMEAYEARRPSYFATPATNLIAALPVALDEVLQATIDGQSGTMARVAQHTSAANALRGAWSELGLSLVPSTRDIAANTLSAIVYPDGVGPELVGAIKDRGVVVAGGLHPAMKAAYFRVGHMGWVVERRELLIRTVRAVGDALVAAGHGSADDVERAARRLS